MSNKNSGKSSQISCKIAKFFQENVAKIQAKIAKFHAKIFIIQTKVNNFHAKKIAKIQEKNNPETGKIIYCARPTSTHFCLSRKKPL